MPHTQIFFFQPFFVCGLTTDNKRITNQRMWEVPDVQNCLSVKTAYDMYIHICLYHLYIVPMLKYISAFVQTQLWCLNCLYSEFEKFVMERSDMYLCWSPTWHLFASLSLSFRNKSLFSNSIVPICCVPFYCVFLLQA